MIVLHLTSMALAVTAGATSPTVQPAARPSVADSATEAPLTEDDVKRYIAARKDIEEFWKDSTHADLHKTLDSKAQLKSYTMWDVPVQLKVVDYRDLAKQNQEVAAIFTKHHLTPHRYDVVDFSVGLSLIRLAIVEKGVGFPPDGSTVAGKNFPLVKPHRDELAAVGASSQVDVRAGADDDGGAGDGGGDNLDP